jgi:hypothetical protein
VENPDLEAVRQIAVELSLNFELHEMEPWQAESYVRDVGRRLVDLVGYPDGWFSYEFEDGE